jgi:hypothetical protein
MISREDFSLSAALQTKLTTALAATDQLALANVTHDESGESILDAAGRPIKGRFSRGGPFGALLALTYDDDRLEIIGAPRGNNVVGSGIASAHAEDQALKADNYAVLVERLSSLSAAGNRPFVWVVSSGQSCTTCHTKQEIMARDLIERRLVEPGHVVTLYGATYDETFHIAQFYDAQYADAMIFFSLFPEHKDNLVRQEVVRFQAVPFDVQEILRHADGPTAVVVRHNEIYAIGRDKRTASDPFATAEVNAVRAACTRNRQQDGVFASWTVDGELYTTTPEIGPLLFAEAGWTNIGVVRAVQMPATLKQKQFETRETPRIDNATFLKIIAGGYRDAHAALDVVRDSAFVNTAQPKWAELLRVNDEQLYNGAAVTPAVETMRNLYTRFRFAAAEVQRWPDNKRAAKPLRALSTRPAEGLVL